MGAIHFKNPIKPISFYSRYTTNYEEFWDEFEEYMRDLNIGNELPDDDYDYDYICDDCYNPWENCVIKTQRYFGKHGRYPVITERKDLKKIYNHYLQRVIHFQPLGGKETEKKTFSWLLEDMDRIYFFSEHEDYDKGQSYFYLHCRLKGIYYVYIYYQIDEILKYYNRKYFPFRWREAPEEYDDAWKLHYKAWYTRDPNVFFTEAIKKDIVGDYHQSILDFMFKEEDNEKDFQSVIKIPRYFGKFGKCPIFTEPYHFEKMYRYFLEDEVEWFQPLKMTDHDDKTIRLFKWFQDIEDIIYVKEYDDYDNNKSYFHIYCNIMSDYDFRPIYIYVFFQIDQIIERKYRTYGELSLDDESWYDLDPLDKSLDDYKDKIHYKAWYTTDENVFFNEAIEKNTFIF